jgi:hypothetical protein
LHFLRTLVSKIASDAERIAYAAVGFVKRAWKLIPSNVTTFAGFAALGGALGMMSTKRGYHVAVDGLSYVLKKVRSLVIGVARAINHGSNNAVCALGKLLAKNSVTKTVGVKIQDVSNVVVAKIASVINFVENYTLAVGTHTMNALRSKIATRITTHGIKALIAAFVINAFTGQSISFSLVTLPVVGKFLAAAVSGGVATLYAALILVFIGSLIAALTTIKKDFSAIKNSMSDMFKMPFLPNRTENEVRPADTDEDAEVISEIKGANAEGVIVEVTGDVSSDTAEAIAEKHIDIEIATLENVISKRRFTKRTKR